METGINITKGNNGYRQSIVALLQSENLPVEDINGDMKNFIIALDNENIIEAVALEKYDDCGLLRSLVVNKNYRNKNVAAALIKELEEIASALGINCIYLLTETAPGYFAKKGYEKINRDDVPCALRKSSEFTHVCPQSAIVMKKPVS